MRGVIRVGRLGIQFARAGPPEGRILELSFIMLYLYNKMFDRVKHADPRYCKEDRFIGSNYTGNPMIRTTGA